MNLLQIKLLKARGWTFAGITKREDLYVAIATKPRSDGVVMKAEAGNQVLRKAENRLVHIIIDEPKRKR